MIDNSMLFHCLHMLHTYVNCHSADAAVFLVMPLLIVKRLLSEITQRDRIGSAVYLPKKKKIRHFISYELLSCNYEKISCNYEIRIALQSAGRCSVEPLHGHVDLDLDLD